MADLAKKYTPMPFPQLKGLKGISDARARVALQAVRGLRQPDQQADRDAARACRSKGEAAGTNPAYAEMTRRLGFEYNGMVLHEYYFGNMKPGGSGASRAAS